MTFGCESGIKQLNVSLKGLQLIAVLHPTAIHMQLNHIHLFFHEAAQPVCGCQSLAFFNHLRPDCTCAGMLS